MTRSSPVLGILIILLLCFCPLGYAAKYKPINEIPHEVPADEEEQRIWAVGKAHQEKVRKTGEVINDSQMEADLEALAARLMGDMVETIGLEVNVLIFKDPTVNAWVYPDGTIAVQTGLLAELRNEAQLAAILGHEISHFLNRHAYIQIKSKQTQSVIGKGLGLLATAVVASKTGAVNTGLMDAGQIWTDLVTSGYSRKLEHRADVQGLELLVAAGYDPNQALPAFEALRIKDDDQVNVGKIWSSHPDIDSRLKNLKKRIKKIKSPPSFIPSEQAYVKAYGKAMLIDVQLDVQRKRYQRALATLQRYTDVMNNPEGHYLMGEVYRKQSPEGPDYSPRTTAYQRAITADKNFALAHKELGMAYRQQGQNTQAATALGTYLELAPDAADAPIIQWYLQDMNVPTSPQAADAEVTP